MADREELLRRARLAKARALQASQQAVQGPPYAPVPAPVMPAQPQAPGTAARVMGAPVDLVNRAISPALRAVGIEPAQAPVGGAESIQSFLTGGETPAVDIGGQMVENFPESAAQFAQDVATPFMQPVETAKAVGNLLLGVAQKFYPGAQESEATADAVGQFFLNRYGDWEAIKKTLAEDPVGFMGDLATVMTGGGAMAARAPGAVGAAAKAVQSAGSALDPLAVVGRVAAPVARRAAPAATALVGDVLTGAGGRSIEEAAQAGYQGGRRGEAFRRAIGGAPMEEVVTEARQAVNNIRQRRGQMYRQGMAKVAGDKTVLDFGPIDEALSEAVEVKRFKGQPIGTASDVADDIAESVNQWKLLDPAEFHTPEGLDALKQKIGAIRDRTQFGTPDRSVADQAYNAVKGQIVQQAPEYARVMRDYWEASDLIQEMERTLSLNPKAQLDTSLRKLQSLLRNNANTNYGRRLVLGEMLEEAGAGNLMTTLAGQALQPLAPRGLARAVAGATTAGGVGVDPLMLGLLPFQSPRVMGEAAYLGGMGARQIGRAPNVGLPVFQAGRVTDIERNPQRTAGRTPLLDLALKDAARRGLVR